MSYPLNDESLNRAMLAYFPFLFNMSEGQTLFAQRRLDAESSEGLQASQAESWSYQ